jgi:NitT/TauT family transport system substrate-binding protein
LIRHARRVAALALVPILLAGCGVLGDKPPEAGPAGNLEKGTITVATVPTVDLAPFWIALDGGYFEAQGLHVREVSNKDTSTALTKVQSGEADVGLATYPAMFIAQDQGIGNLRFVSDGTYAKSGSNQLVTVPNSPVKTVNDLAGKRIGITSETQASGILTKSVMHDHNVDYSGVHWVPLAFPDMAPALQRDQIDAAYMPEPFLTQAASTVGAFGVVDAGSGSTQDFPLTGYTAKGEWAQNNPRTMAAFQRAMINATRAAADRGKVEEVVPKHTKVTADIAKLMKLPGFETKPDGVRIQRVADLLFGLHVISKKIEATPMIAPQPAG